MKLHNIEPHPNPPRLRGGNRIFPSPLAGREPDFPLPACGEGTGFSPPRLRGGNRIFPSSLAGREPDFPLLACGEGTAQVRQQDRFLL